MPVEFVRTMDDGSKVKLLMRYDGEGRRVSKTTMHGDSEDNFETDKITYYTAIGSEVRVTTHDNGQTNDVKVVVNMPQGLGRYGVEDAKGRNYEGLSAGVLPTTNFEWYLKNHLGSTMLVYGTHSVANRDLASVGAPIASYDYRAFGEQLSMMKSSDKVTENFTGKCPQGECCENTLVYFHCRAAGHSALRQELDDEIELNYFGARYLDPMLGLWISVDAARQFASPYLYMGNGANPIVLTDTDGNVVPLPVLLVAPYVGKAVLGAVGGVAFGIGSEYVKSRMEGREFNYTKIELEMDATYGAIMGATGTGGVALGMAHFGGKLTEQNVMNAVATRAAKKTSKLLGENLNETVIGEAELEKVGEFLQPVGEFLQPINDALTSSATSFGKEVMQDPESYAD